MFPRSVGSAVRVDERRGIVIENHITWRGKKLIRVVFSDREEPERLWCEPEEVKEWEPTNS